jgi:Zn-dependent protease with chaperone function
MTTLSSSPRRSIEPAFTLSGSIEPTRLSMAYRAGLVVVAIAMVLLPVIYLALIVATGAAVWWHLTQNTWMLSGRSTQWRLLFFLTPAVVGVVLLFFMVKPILARPARRQEPVPILPEAEPALFAFIHQICAQVRAPIPRRVQVDCQVNASASFLPGPLGILKRDLALTIGLPLAAGLSVRELGGVLAHEFGHFAQGGGMRLTMIVRSVNAWFARVVYERDKWDEKLAGWAKDSDWRISIVLGLAMAAIWVSRKILTGLMMAGHAISCFMMRQMEYDADSYEVKFSGTGAFARTSARLREMNVAAQVSYGELGNTLATRSLPANLPLFVADRLSRLPDGLLEQLRAVPAGKTGIFDTHPSDADRVRAADAIGAPGVLIGGDVAATGLFRDFEALGAAATRHHYEHDLGLSLPSLTLVDTQRAVQDSRSRESYQRALHRFFGERTSTARPLRLPLAELEGLDDNAVRASLERARASMDAAGGATAAQFRRVEEIETRRAKAFAAGEILRAGLGLESGAQFELAEPTAACAASTEAWAVEQIQALAPALDAMDEAAARRLACAARLAAEAGGAGNPRVLAATFDAVARGMPAVRDLRRFAYPFELLGQLTAASPQVGVSRSALAKEIKGCRARMREALAGTACPDWLSETPADLATWVGLTKAPEASTAAVMERVMRCYVDLLGRLAAVALEVEDARTSE